MSKFLELLEEEGFDLEAVNPVIEMNVPLNCNIKKLLGAAIEDILLRYSTIYNEYVENGVEFDFEKSVILPQEGLKFNLIEHVRAHLEDLE